MELVTDPLLLANEITSNLRSAATTTTQTLKSLRELLGELSDERTEKSLARPALVSKRNVPDAKCKPVTKRYAKNAKSTASLSTEIIENTGRTGKVLSLARKRKLATEAFNASLKCLAENVKRRQEGERNAGSPVEKALLQGKNSRKPTSQQTQSDSRENHIRTNGAGSLISLDVDSVADCAITALDCLREFDIEESKDDARKDGKLDQGALVLVEKLISLGMSQRSVREMAKLYEQYWKRRKDNHCKGTLGSGTHRSKLDINICLDPITKVEDKPTSIFATSYQSQALRLLILLGSQVVTDDLVACLSVDCAGSPADMILRSFKSGLLEKDKAAQQLRTVAQALIKLYSISTSDKQLRDEKSRLNLMLLCEALSIKCRSWNLSCHKPDLNHEYWTLISKGLKRFGTDHSKTHEDEAPEFCTRQIRRVSLVLQQSGFESTVPTDIVCTLMDVADSRRCKKDTTDFIREQLHNATTLTEETRAISAWRIAVMQHRSFSTRDEHLLDCLRSASASFDTLDLTSMEDPDAIFLHSARLRKTSLAIFSDLEQSIEETKGREKDNIAMQSQCAEIILKLLDLQSNLIHGGNASSAVQTGFAKTFEAMLDLCKPYLKRPSFIPQQYVHSIQCCVQISNLLLSTEDVSAQPSQIARFVQSLLMQVSHLYWMRYLEVCDISDSIEINDLLEQSCNAVSNLSTEVQRSAGFAAKLEKLALAYLRMQDRDAARESFFRLITYYIAIGALDEATSAALSQPSHTVWSKKGSKSCSLGKALQSHAQVCLTYDLKTSADGCWIYDEQNLPPTHRVALLEAQLVAATEHDFSQSQTNALAEYACDLSKLCHTPRLAVYVLRFLRRLLQLQSKNQSVILDTIFESDHVQNLVGTTVSMDGDVLLESYAYSIHDQVNIQLLLQYGCRDTPKLDRLVASLCSVVIEAPDLLTLETAVDNVDFLIKQLQTVVGYGRAMVNTQIVANCLSSLSHILKLSPETPKPQLIDILTQLASLYHQTGNTLEAGKIFAEEERLLAQEIDDMVVIGRWAFAYVQYLADVSNMEKAVEVFSNTIQQFEMHQSSPEVASSKRRLEKDALICSAALTASGLAFRRGQLEQANLLARQSVKLSTAIWQALERPTETPSESSPAQESEATLSVLVGEISNLAISSEQGGKQPKVQGSRYWASVDLHCSALRHMTETSMHNGLYQDAVYYAEQLKRISLAVNSNVRRIQATILLAVVHAKAGHQLQANSLLDDLGWSQMDLDNVETRWSAVHYAEALIEVGHLSQASALLDTIEIHPLSSAKPTVIDEISKTGIKKAPVRGKVRVVRPTKLPPKRPGQPLPDDSEGGLSGEVEKGQTHFKACLSEKCFALRNRIILLSKEVGPMSQQLEATKTTTSRIVDSSVTTAMIMLQQALHEFSSDSVHCVLSETAVALPVRYKSARKSGRISFVQTTESSTAARTPKSGRARSTILKRAPIEASLSAGEKLVIDAQKLLASVQSKGKCNYSSDVLHLAQKVQSRLSLLSSAVNAPITISSLEMVWQLLTPKNLIQERHQLTIKAERATKDKAQILAWPDVSSLQGTNVANTTLDCSMDDLADLPQTWSIISISLAENQQELIMSKIVGNRSPFVLRIPLSRSDVDIDEDGDFTFAEAKSELFDIFTNANTSAHDKRGQGDKEARKAWYRERASLDQRLEAWLNSIESIWLGGFRGLMSSDDFDDDLTTKFGQNLNRILDKHLPSRQRSSKTNKDKVVLHAHVLELFLGLGDPEEQEIDDAVTDLLYFVVDILQFNRERNAYDEIDFDAILVDVLDELRSCRDAISRSQHSRPRHTVLIVDKELASFPWESLPCLKDQAVSRMPSLSSVIQRLRKIRSVSPTADGHNISGTNGSYVLNPSGDLVSTQTTFEPILRSQLSDFQRIVGEPPSESTFSSALTNSELFLYFGHGSGAQYIRGRTIRNLDNCAVTLLMGCSSGKMNECGRFENYGMPDYYIGGLSGCMAVVGTLWDVTDRDIDRFALRTMAEWGLIEEDESVTQAMRKGSRKATTDANMQASRKRNKKDKRCALDEAVNRGRDACLLRYLNGAAPVVYGVPVFLH